MRLMIICLFLSFHDFVVAKAAAKNPFTELGCLIYTLIQPVDCGFNEMQFTITASAARGNRVKSLQVYDTLHKRGPYDCQFEFDSMGRLVHFFRAEQEYIFQYDSLLETKNVTRISKVVHNQWSDGSVFFRFWTEIKYDEYGNPVSQRSDGNSNFSYLSQRSYRYVNKIRYQYAYAYGMYGGDTVSECYRYDRKSGMLFVKKGDDRYRLRGSIPVVNIEHIPDTIRYGDKYFDCIDTIPDGRYTAIAIDTASPSVHWTVKRDSLGRIIQIWTGPYLWRSTAYSSSGLPESAVCFRGKDVGYYFLFKYFFFESTEPE